MTELELFLIAYSIATTIVLLRIAYQNYKAWKFRKLTAEALSELAKTGERLLKEAGKSK